MNNSKPARRIHPLLLLVLAATALWALLGSGPAADDDSGVELAGPARGPAVATAAAALDAAPAARGGAAAGPAQAPGVAPAPRQPGPAPAKPCTPTAAAA